MIVALIIIIVLIIIILVLFAPLKMKAMLHINILNGVGSFSLSYSFIKLASGRIFIKDRTIDILLKFNIFLQPNEDINMNKMIKMILNKIDLYDVYILYFIGNSFDAFTTSMISGYYNMFVSSFASIVKNKYPKAKVTINNNSNFKNDILCTTINLSLYLSIYNVLISLISSKNKKEIKNEI